MKKERQNLKRVCASLLLLGALLGCNIVAAPATPARLPGAATRPAITASPTLPPSPTALPTPSHWMGWRSSGDNLALKKRVRVSHAAYGHGGPAAVDGSLRTFWSSGTGPIQWIEIDLGGSYDIAEIHLVPAQTSPGVTLHHILGRGPLGGEFRSLYSFNSQVSDSPLLAYASSSAWENVQIIRIETTFSAGPVGWKEVEIIRAEH